MSATDGKIEIENANKPAKTARVERAKYEAMRVALLSVLPGTGRSPKCSIIWRTTRLIWKNWQPSKALTSMVVA
ncbi:DUF6958 family protein [Pelagibacterium sp. H642]|uniref:DUF6958 family protein n=1 Tax=Pelagibacterium sp. H642 TaxID=1881069 RepID=UPI0028150F2F|nr:hypothetical protein [Pelagibacterium sp. H642]WMT90439.1 hypothetical protein NO934_16900 [Pelagibacterium sp. H642]